MTKKKETACTDPARLCASGSKGQIKNSTFHFNPQGRKMVQGHIKAFIVRLALWGLLPISWADKLVEGLRHD